MIYYNFSSEVYLLEQLTNQNSDDETKVLIEELKQMLDLDPKQSVFRITDQLIQKQPDEITIRVRSLLTMMGFLANGIEVPAEHMSQDFVENNIEFFTIC